MNVQCSENFPVLADFIAGNLLLVIQEAMCNAIKHAHPSNIDIELEFNPENDHVRVSVRDDGIGFNLQERPTSRDAHFGVEGMEERVGRLGGDFVLEVNRVPEPRSESRFPCERSTRSLSRSVDPSAILETLDRSLLRRDESIISPLAPFLRPTSDRSMSQTPSSQPLRLLLVDDHAVMRAGLANMLNARSEFVVSGRSG